MKIVIVDDDILVAKALKTIIETSGEISVVATGNDGSDGIALYKQYKPDILLMDIRMQKMTGIEAAEKILSEYPDAKILFLTTFSDDEYITKSLQIGVKGYILKQNYDKIIPALEAVNDGHNVFGDEIISKLPQLLVKSSKNQKNDFGLNEKEIQIISYIAKGLSNKEISSQLCFSEGTIRNYISIILEKLSLRDRTQLAIFYYNNLV
jgi:DNA-binding NarL/FixJ family response regulator